MNNDISVLATLALVVIAALLGGVAARLARLPVVVGYILVGALVGAFSEGLGVSKSATYTIAEFGVALLLFVVGVEFSLSSLREGSRLAVIGAPVQIAVVTLAGFFLARALGFGPMPSLIAGYALSLSSTALGLKLLEGKSEVGSGYTVAALSYALVQDLSLVFALALLPIAAKGASLGEAAVQVGVALGILLVALSVALRLFPWMLRAAALLQTRELFLLLVVGICLGAAYGAHHLGITPALGAFLAGLMISETEFAHEALAEIIPFRELFGAVFFISMGMMVDAEFIVRNWAAVLVLSALVLVGKAALIALLTRLLGWHLKVALAAGLSLSQIGEFSFLVASGALVLGLVPEELYDLLIGATAVTILVSPLLFALLDPLSSYVVRHFERPRAPKRLGRAGPLHDHVILGGCGRVGTYILKILSSCGVEVVVIDFDQRALRTAREGKAYAIFGDAANREILKRCKPETARVALLTMPDAFSCESAAKTLKGFNPNLTILARAHGGDIARHFETIGVTSAVLAEEETAKAMGRLALVACGMEAAEAESHLAATARMSQHEGFE